jgi:hypothetical protein
MLETDIVTPGGVAPDVQQLKPRFLDYHPGSKRTKVRYGKYRLPSVNEDTVMSRISGEPGTMATGATRMKKPCETCSLTVLQAGLEYPNGTIADLSNGAWLHHVLLLVGGNGRKDNVCSFWPGERIFSSSKELTVTAFGDVGKKTTKAAFPIGPTDVFTMQLELMNMDVLPRDVFLTLDYEYIPGPRPEGWKIAKAMWLDITNCGISSMNPPRGKMQFTIASRPWTSSFDGDLLGVGE